MMSGNSETVDYHLRKIYDTLDAENKQDYVRLEPSRGSAVSKMDCVTKKNIDALHEAGNMYIYDNQEKLNQIAAKLVKYA